MASTASGVCIYCGHGVGRQQKGEHIIPKALGGGKSIKHKVCPTCNNGRLSEIDNELSRRSPLSVIASQEMDTHLWQVWDVDHDADNLLLEARPNWPNKNFVQYPQLIVDSDSLDVRGDYEEMGTVGREAFVPVFIEMLLRAFQRHKAGEKGWLHVERIPDNPRMMQEYRLPPRFFARHSIAELVDRWKAWPTKPEKTSFILRYLTADDQQRALSALEQWNPDGLFDRPLNRCEIRQCSHAPAIRWSYGQVRVLRGLWKIALNVLAANCEETPVDRDSFPEVVRVITGERPVDSGLLRNNGFTWASDIEPIRDPGGGHSLRIVYLDGHWIVATSYFGGRIGSHVRFPGPHREKWVSATITAPLRSAEWIFRPSRILQPLTVRIEWLDAARIMPSVELINVKAEPAGSSE